MQIQQPPGPADGERETGRRPPRAGDRVRVRRQRWRVVDAQAYEACELLTLYGLGSLNHGMRLRVVSPFDLVEPLDSVPVPRIVGPRQWRRLCRTLLADDGGAAALRSARNARIDLLPHQLEPALAVVRGMGSRVLIADDVGLGKTIQAALVIAELKDRHAAERVLILVPAGLRDQWAGELAGRFGLDASILDMHEGRRRAAVLPIGANPWAIEPVVIASIDYAKKPEVLPAIASCRWDVIVVDEAHAVTPGSDRHSAVSALCRAAGYVLLLTATPHSGDRCAFQSLCGLGEVDDDTLLMFRRTRRDAALREDRRIHRLRIRPSAAEAHMHAVLARLAHLVRTERGEVNRDTWLALTLLHKRAFSSPTSLERSVRRRLMAQFAPTECASHQLQLPLDAGDVDEADEPPELRGPILKDPETERQLLTALAEAARAAAMGETKLAALRRLLARCERRGESVLVFTEYRDTLLHVRQALARPCAVIHGGLAREERRLAIDAFVGRQLRILLATDAAGQGLNLHATCRVVINLELPWNPMRLEQRIGRVDRIGQERAIHAFHLIARGTGEERILDRLRLRLARAREDVGTPDPLGDVDWDGGDDPSPASAAAHDPPDGQRAPAAMPSRGHANPGRGIGVSSRRGWGPAASGRKTVMVRLAIEADLARARLIESRSLAGAIASNRPADFGGAAISFARRPAIRARLAGRILVILQSMLTDGLGRVFASHVTGLLACVPRPFSRRDAASTVGELVRRLESIPLDAVDPAFRSWKDESMRIHEAFWATKLTRERGIVQALAERHDEALQPGLFDRRAEYERAADDALRRALHEALAQHAAAAERALAVELTPPRAAAVLVP